jgi:hypothetical protein
VRREDLSESRAESRKVIRGDPPPCRLITRQPVLQQHCRDSAKLRGTDESLAHPPAVVSKHDDARPYEINDGVRHLDVLDQLIETL